MASEGETLYNRFIKTLPQIRSSSLKKTVPRPDVFHKCLLQLSDRKPLNKIEATSEQRKGLEGSHGEITEHEGNSKQQTSPDPDVDEDQKFLNGLKNDLLALKMSLLHGGHDSKLKVIAFTGKRGVGKSSLCKLFLEQQDVKGFFSPRICVCLLCLPNKERDFNKAVLDRILRSLGVDEKVIESIYNKHQLRGLLYTLRLQLIGKRYLIVLDGVWKDEKFYKNLVSSEDKDHLTYGLPKGHGGTIIVTSRKEELAKGMVGEENLRRLMPLENQDGKNVEEIKVTEAKRAGLDRTESKETEEDAGLREIYNVDKQIEKNLTEEERSNRQSSVGAGGHGRRIPRSLLF